MRTTVALQLKRARPAQRRVQARSSSLRSRRDCRPANNADACNASEAENRDAACARERRKCGH